MTKWIRHRQSMHEVIKLIKPKILDAIPGANSINCASHEIVGYRSQEVSPGCFSFGHNLLL